MLLLDGFNQRPPEKPAVEQNHREGQLPFNRLAKQPSPRMGLGAIQLLPIVIAHQVGQVLTVVGQTGFGLYFDITVKMARA
jgi:hypothetical protein